MSEKRASLRERRAKAMQEQTTPAPVVEEAPPSQPTPPVPVAPTQTARSNSVTTVRIGVTLTPEDLDEARTAFLSDLDRLAAAPPSLTRWIVRAIQRHLDRTPQQRREAAEEHPGTGSDTRKIPYSTAVPADMREDLKVAVVAERAVGLSTNVSGLIREAIAIEVDAARTRAGGILPTLTGPLPHAR